MPEPTPTELAYFAGIVDGEGCISLSLPRGKRVIQAAVTVSMGDAQVPEWLGSVYGGSVYVEPPKPGRTNCRDMTTWRVSGRKAVKVCAAVLPYLKVKHQQARLVLHMYANPEIQFVQGARVSDEQYALRQEYAKQMRTLNARGV